MADTEFSGKLMGLESGVFNPSYSSKTSIVVEYVTPVITDMALVDYLVHGKDIMTQVFDVTIGDLPYHTVENIPEEVKKQLKMEKKEKEMADKGKAVHFSPIPKWYDTKTWNEMQVALRHKVPATCSFSKNPEYTIFHTAPTHSKVDFTVTHFAPEFIESVIFKDDDTFHSVVFEVPETMTETVPLTIKKTSKVVYERDDSRDFMEYDEAYASLTGKALSPFFGMKGMKLINAKLNYIGGFEDKEEEDADEYDPLYGVDYIDESDAEIEHARSMKAYTERLLKAAHNVDEFHREHKLSGSILSWSYKMSRAMTSSGMMEGVDALNEYKATPGAFVFYEFEDSHCPEHYTVDEMDKYAQHSIYTDDSTVMEDPTPMDDATGRVHYRAGHWLTGDVAETRAQERVAKTFGASVLNLVKPQPFRKGVNSKISIAKVVAIEDEVVFFGAPDEKTEKLHNTGMGMIINPKRAVKMSADVDIIISVLTSEPKFAKEIGELVGMSKTKVAKILKTAALAGLVKVVTVKNRETNFIPTATYYI